MNPIDAVHPDPILLAANHSLNAIQEHLSQRAFAPDVEVVFLTLPCADFIRDSKIEYRVLIEKGLRYAA